MASRISNRDLQDSNGEGEYQLELFFKRATTSNLRGHSMKLFKGRSRLVQRQNFFLQRVVNDWNNLLDSVVTSETTNLFKNRLDKHWRDMK